MQTRRKLSEITVEMLSPLLPPDTTVTDIQATLEAHSLEEVFTLEELVVEINLATEQRVHSSH